MLRFIRSLPFRNLAFYFVKKKVYIEKIRNLRKEKQRKQINDKNCILIIR